jgi:hypothetical protein
LNLILSSDEEVVGLHHSGDDLLEGGDQLFLPSLKGFLLLCHESWQQVDSLLDVGDASTGNLLELLHNFLLVVLEFLYVGVDFKALTSAIVDEVVD